MTLLRPLLLLVVVAFCLKPCIQAQEGAGTATESGVAGEGETLEEGAESKPKPAPAPKEGETEGGKIKPMVESQDQKPESTGTDTTTSPNPFMEGIANPFGTGSGAATAFGTSTTEEGAEQEAVEKEKVGNEETTTTLKPKESSQSESFSAPGLYGSGSVNFTAGEGRMAKPRFRYTGTIGLGYDDNYLQAPTKQIVFPEQRFLVITDFGAPEIFALQQVEERTFKGYFNNQPQFETRTFLKKIILQPGRDPEFEEIVIPEFRGLKRESTFITQGNLNFDVQWIKRRTLFTFDLNIGADYYWARKSDPTEYNGSLALNFIHRFSPRLQFSTVASMTYSAQPDYSQLVGSTISNSGSYLAGSIKFDLSNRWARRFTTDTSLNINMLSYEEETRTAGNYQEYTLGNEFRYLWSPRFTSVAELRYSTQEYPESPVLDNNTFYALIGADWKYSRNLGSTLRIGQATKTFKQPLVEEEAQTSPYMELSLNYRLGPRTQFGWTNRFGFEQTSSASTEVQGFRSNMNISHAFSPRLRGNMGFSYTKQTSTTEGVVVDNSTTYLDGNMGLQYIVNRKFVLGMRYSYSQQITTQEVQDYYRNRLFFTASFEY